MNDDIHDGTRSASPASPGLGAWEVVSLMPYGEFLDALWAGDLGG